MTSHPLTDCRHQTNSFSSGVSELESSIRFLSKSCNQTMKIKKEPQCSSGQGRRQTKTIIIHSAFTLIDNITNFDKNGLLMGVCKIYAVSQKLQHFTFNQDFPRSTIIYCLKSSNGTVLSAVWEAAVSAAQQDHKPRFLANW